MKYLLVIAVVVIAFYIWRKSHPRVERTRRPPTAPSGTPQTMVRCAHCGLHLPAADAVSGERGVYCGAPHRLLAEPPP